MNALVSSIEVLSQFYSMYCKSILKTEKWVLHYLKGTYDYKRAKDLKPLQSVDVS